MGIFDSFRRKPGPLPDPPGRRGYYATHDALDSDDWDSRLDRLDSALDAEEKKRTHWWQREHWTGRRKRWWALRILAAILALFIVLAAWLACLLYTSPSPRDRQKSRMPSSA